MREEELAKARAAYWANREIRLQKRRARTAATPAAVLKARRKRDWEKGLLKKDFKHGVGGYAHHKCKCPICVAATKEARKGKSQRKVDPETRRQKRKQASAHAKAEGFKRNRHGSPETYRLGCRCSACKDEKRRKKQELRAQRNLLPLELRRIKAASARKWTRGQRKTNPAFRVAEQLVKRVRELIIKPHRTGPSTRLIGCKGDMLRQFLASKFTPGMGWHNYGSAWHVDHIRPCASFDLTDPEQQRQCFHYTNLQPLWAELNSWKRDRILPKWELEYEIAMVPFPS